MAVKMSGKMITNINHFLKDDGTFYPEKGSPARNLASHLCSIVESVTKQSPVKLQIVPTGMKCRKRPSRKPCKGIIQAVTDEDGQILWRCPVCKYEGIITGWKNSSWDISNLN